MIPIIKAIEIYKRLKTYGSEGLSPDALEKDKRYLKKHNPTAFALLFPWMTTTQKEHFLHRSYSLKQYNFQKFTQNKTFGIITAHKPFYEANSQTFEAKSAYSDQSHQASLRIRCQSLGLPTQLVEISIPGEEYKPEGVLVENITKPDIIFLGKIFNQDAVLYQESNKGLEILTCEPVLPKRS
jgi:hypothetical protein